MKRLEKKYGTALPLLVYTDLEVVDEQLNVIAPVISKIHESSS